MGKNRLTCFQLLKSVLDEVWTQLSGTDPQKVVAVRAKGEQLRAHYRQLATNGSGVD
jgi:hypothetical protein